MRADISKFGRDTKRDVEVLLWSKLTTVWVDVINGTATGSYDLGPYMTNGKQTAFDATFRFVWGTETTFLDNQPSAGDLIEIKERGIRLWLGVVDELNNFNEERGNRSVSMVARSRDGVGSWRKKRFTSSRFQQGNLLSAAVQDILKDQGLNDLEFDVPLAGYTVPHVNVQFADTTPWQALTDLGLAMGYSPICDANGVVKFYSRAVDRVADIVLTTDDVIRISGGKSNPSISSYRLKWLDRNLTKVVQQTQSLAQEVITAGFFKGEEKREVFWSDDRRARAQNTYLKTIQSINDSLLPIGDEDYEEKSSFHGEIIVEVDAWVSGLATVSLVAMLALDNTPDGVVVAGFGASTGYTVPYGRILRGIAEAALLLIMMSMGNGVYEVWGEPFDFVHAVNKTEAFDDAAPAWMTDVIEEENDLIFDENHAQEVTIRELLHRVAENNRWNTDVADDPRMEVGDILELPDGARLYVTDYSRDLTRGSVHVLKLSGFRS